MKLRASRLPLAMICPASTKATEYDLNSDSEPARLGTVVHEWLATRISDPTVLSQLADEAFEQLAVKYTLPMEDIRALSLRAWQLWREVQQWFPSPRLEVAMAKDMDGLSLTGHVDVLSYNAESRIVFVNDHKTGFLDSDHADQVRAYGLMALELYPEADQVHTCIMKVRDFVTDHANYSRTELLAWAARVVQRLVEEGDSYQPGRHCSFCPRRLTCPAFRDWVRWAVSLLDGGEFIDFASSASPELVRKVYDAKSVLKRLVDEAGEVLRTLTLASGGSLPRDDDYQLQLISQIRQTVQFREAWPILGTRIEPEHWNSVFRVSKTELLSVVRMEVGRGEKKHAAAEMMAQLEAAGALAEQTIERLELRKKTDPQLEA